MPLWDDATAPFTGQQDQQPPQDNSSLWGWLSSMFQPGQPFKSGNPALDQMMMARNLPDPQPRDQPQPLGSTLMDLASTVAPYLVGGAPAGSLSSGMRLPGKIAQTAEEAAPIVRTPLSQDGAIAEIQKAISRGDHPDYGLRVTEEPIPPGKIGPSRLWEDGEPSADQLLPGTSVVHIDGDDTASIQEALKNAGIGGLSPNGSYYFGKHVTLVGGERLSPGEDAGEALFRNAQPVMRFERGGQGAAPIEAMVEPAVSAGNP
jgi:hypothetical protein